MTKKHKQLVLALVFVPLCLLSSYWGLMTLIRGRDARDISEQIATAHKAAEKIPMRLAAQKTSSVGSKPLIQVAPILK